MFTRLHHLGLVVGDLEAAKSLWLDTYGFSVDEQRSPLPDGRNVQLDNVNILDIPVGESELEINMANDPHSGTGKFLEKRGAGPHHICLYSDDMDVDVQQLKDAGQQIVVPPTGSASQEGGSRVAFAHPKSNLGFLLEIWQNMPVNGIVPEPPRGKGGSLTYVHHVGVVCNNFEEALALFRDTYGLKIDQSKTPLPNGRFAESDNVKILEFLIGESRIEVSVPLDETSGTAKFLANRGPGIHHVCFYSENIESDVSRLNAAGLTQIGEVNKAEEGGTRVTFYHPKSNMGILVELWQDI